MSARVFLAGGTGVLGRRVLPQLLAAGHDVTANCRQPEVAARIESSGATPVTVDLFHAAAVQEAVDGHDVVVNIATAIPTGIRAGLPRAWGTNDRLRNEAAANLAAATPKSGRYVGESITFPYVDFGDQWIDESVARDYSRATESCRAAEASALAADGVVLRFAMFWAEDSAHNEELLAVARRGLFGLPGAVEAYASWIHIDDAAAAVVAAIGVKPGVYNVVEANPQPRSAHIAAIAAALGRRRLRTLPGALVKLGGPPFEAMARSQRVSSAALADASDWTPTQSIVDLWSHL
jgi:nucleoside-diphosphate-sugar epimerase